MCKGCFDHHSISHLQAAFEIKLRTPVGLTALTNMPLEHTHPAEGGLQTSHFQTSPPMSTYLVAFIVGNLTHVSTTVPAPAGAASGESRPVSIYGTPQRLAKGRRQLITAGCGGWVCKSACSSLSGADGHLPTMCSAGCKQLNHVTSERLPSFCLLPPPAESKAAPCALHVVFGQKLLAKQCHTPNACKR